MARKFGLEVEYGGSIDTALSKLYEAGLALDTMQASYTAHSQTHWVVKRDGSVSNGGEMVGPPLDFDDPEQRAQVTKAVECLRSSGAFTEEAAGIHVHVDASDLTAYQVACVARLFTKFEDVLYRLASSGWHKVRRGGATYCQPLSDLQIQGLAKAKNERQLAIAYYGHEIHGRPDHGNRARYRGINLHSWFYRGTIEFRIFNSSLNADRIQAYVAICVALVEDARRGNKRNVNKAYRLGGMKTGTTPEKSAYHRFQQVMRYEAGMSLEDYKLMNKIWKDSKPQQLLHGAWQ